MSEDRMFEKRYLVRESTLAEMGRRIAELERERDEWDNITDQDLPPVNRTWANLWQAKYFEARLEIANANRGIARLQRKLESAKIRDEGTGIHSCSSTCERPMCVLRRENANLRDENQRLVKILADLAKKGGADE